MQYQYQYFSIDLHDLILLNYSSAVSKRQEIHYVVFADQFRCQLVMFEFPVLIGLS